MLLGLTATAGVGVAAVVAPYLTAIVLAVLVVLLRGMSLTGARASDRRGLRGTRWYDVVLTPLTAPWFLLASLPGTFLLLAWAAALAGSAALVLVALGVGLGWGLFSLGALTALVLWTGPGASRLRSPVRRLALPAGPVRAQLGGQHRLPAGAARRWRVPARRPGHRLVAVPGRAGRRREPVRPVPLTRVRGASGPQACGMETRGPGIGLLRRAVWFSTASRCRAVKTVS